MIFPEAGNPEMVWLFKIEAFSMKRQQICQTVLFFRLSGTVDQSQGHNNQGKKKKGIKRKRERERKK